MVIDKSRKKLIEAIAYFAENTANCSKTKLIKLLYLLDFDHYRQTGRSVTGLEYYAWNLGPVPRSLYEEVESELGIPADLHEAVDLKAKEYGEYVGIEFVAKRTSDLNVFTKREIALLRKISEEHKLATAQCLVDITHQQNQAWDKIFDNGNGAYQHIPYKIALNDSEWERLSKVVEDREDFLSACA